MSPLCPPLAGAPNFRDLGGYITADGARVRSGRVFRSETLARLTDADLASLRGLNIELLYDLRGAEERAREPNRWPADHPVRTLAGLGMDAQDLEAVRLSGWRHRILDPALTADGVSQWIRHAYGEMPRLFSSVLASLFDQLTSPTAPVTLIHCTAGKDRTGFVCAMLLLTLNVPRKGVFHDYLLTSRYRPPKELLAALLGDTFDTLEPTKIDALLALATADTAYLETALGRIDADYGGIDSYLEQACGLTSGKRERLCSNLLA